MTHVNSVTLLGKVLSAWEVGSDRLVRLSIHRPGFYPRREAGPNDLVTVVLPDAVLKGQVVKENAEIHLVGFIKNEDAQVTLASLARGIELPPDLAQQRVKNIMTLVVATQWQLVVK